jgi:hypothetical protein
MYMKRTRRDIILHDSGHILTAKAHHIKIFEIHLNFLANQRGNNYIVITILEPPCYSLRLVKNQIIFAVSGVGAEKAVARRCFAVNSFLPDYTQAMEYAYAYLYSIGLENPDVYQAHRLVRFHERKLLLQLRKRSSKTRIQAIGVRLWRFKKPLAKIREMRW